MEKKETKNILDIPDECVELNAKTKLFYNDERNLDLDFAAAKIYIEKNVEPNYLNFKTVEERFEYLITNNYYEADLISQYKMRDIKLLTDYANGFNHQFKSFMGALKFFNTYALKTFDGKKYLETYTERVIMNALLLGEGSIQKAKIILKQIILNRYQPATPTFLNAGKKQRGEFVSCYLLRVEDNMESIARVVGESLQLSKMGGGVSLCLTNIREVGSPIKNIEGQSSGVIPIMKILEDSFSYSNQLGQRQGAGAVYLNVHHPDIISFLDTKRENADEKIRIKSLSLGIIIPDITFELAKENREMALFSPYDVKKFYGKPLSDISITEEYENLIANEKIKKTYISARKLFQTISELHFESGYPFILFDDNVNNRNAHPERIVMSNLCSEIVQPSTASEFERNLNFKTIGKDICCNLGSLNIAKAMESGSEFTELIASSIRSLNHISRICDLSATPSIENGNHNNHAIGLGAMNLHGFLATNHIYYNSPEAVEFTNVFFYCVAFEAFKASMQLAKEFGRFSGFEKTSFADGSYFQKYTTCEEAKFQPESTTIKAIFTQYQIKVPTQRDWINLVEEIKTNGIANSHLMAIAPTGSISYLSSCTPSLQPIVSPVEVRKEGKIGRVYVPAYQISFDNMQYYAMDAYEIGPKAIIDIAAAAQTHIDQAISLTLFFKDDATSRDLNKAYIYAYKMGCSSIYYVRIRQEILAGSENYVCDACVI
jgi:ribonucleoside-diphosphate reductase alpha chain